MHGLIIADRTWAKKFREGIQIRKMFQIVARGIVSIGNDYLFWL